MKTVPTLATLRLRACAGVSLVLAASLCLSGCGGRPRRDQPLTSLSAADQEMIRQYDRVRGALANDDPRLAKRTAAAYEKDAAATLAAEPKPPAAEFVAKIASANNLDAQRDAFRSWSKDLIKRTEAIKGLYVIHCPVPGCGDWLQTNPTVENPFMGKSMRTCGDVEK